MVVRIERLPSESLERQQQLLPIQTAIEATHFAALVDHTMARYENQQLVTAHRLGNGTAGRCFAIDGDRQFAVWDLLAEWDATQFAPDLQLEIGADHFDWSAEDFEAAVEVLHQFVFEH